MNFAHSILSAAAAALLTTSAVAESDQIALPSGAGEIRVHGLDSFAIMFAHLCLEHPGKPADQKAEVENSVWNFQPEAGRENRWHWESVTFSISPKAERDDCGLTGMASGVANLKTAAERFAEVADLGQATISQRVVGDETLSVAFWTISDTLTAQLISSPQLVLYPDDRAEEGPSHITLILSSQKKEIE